MSESTSPNKKVPASKMAQKNPVIWYLKATSETSGTNQGLTQFEHTKASDTMVREFYTSIIQKQSEYAGKSKWDGINLYVFIFGKEMVITVDMLGLLLKIEYKASDCDPPDDFDFEKAWKGSQNYVNRRDMWLLYCIWTGTKVNLAQIIINGINRMASKNITQTMFVQTAAKDSQIAKAIEGLTTELKEVKATMQQMQKTRIDLSEIESIDQISDDELDLPEAKNEGSLKGKSDDGDDIGKNDEIDKADKGKVVEEDTEPLATTPTSPIIKGKEKASTSAAPSPIKDASPTLKAKKKVTKKASATNVEEPLCETGLRSLLNK
ncbi:hypothetical protein COLO4_16139 [Corchorus olitorius]|uniref:Uncharacterized protein n=1 Tax=Corchorus olitorius TaxID=93759 RepID=A0A1R3JJE9_9ROSI|nr:hypothetical protein COLO4_16139 [Corchorus olitorius]